MRSLAIFLLGSVLSTGMAAHATDNGIFVGAPKLYDDYTLERMLQEAEQSLGALELNKADAISSGLGARQGFQSTRNQFALTASEFPTPSIDNTQSSTPSTVTKTPSVTPAPATLPSSSEPTLPGEPTLSASDRLDELLQLKLRVSNLRLLLRGSLTDQVSLIGDEAVPQGRFTFGFPISISTPAGVNRRDAIAEVEVRVKIDEKCSPRGRPGLKMVLPQEKTYNVAQLKSSTTSIGTGVIAGVFSVGGNWLRGQSQHFLVQDQDTLAFEDQGADQEIVFGWRFKPVLGQRKLQPSLQQLFAQLTFPVPPGAASLGTAVVTTRWRRYERKTGALGKEIPGTPSVVEFPLKRIDLDPGSVGMSLLDLGNGKVRVSLKPSAAFFEGTTFRLGGGTPVEVLRLTDHVDLDLAPLDVVRQGLLLGVRGENERALVNICNDIGRALPLPDDCEAIPSVILANRRIDGLAREIAANPDRQGSGACGDPFFGFKIKEAEPQAVGQSVTRIKLKLDKLLPDRAGEPRFLTLVGGKVFGLRDAPYEVYDPETGTIEFLVDNATLGNAEVVEVVRLLWGSGYHASHKLNRGTKLTVAKHTIISEEGGLLLLLEGQGLNQAKITFPTTAETREKSPGHALVFIPAASTTKLKQLVLQMDTGSPVLVDVSKSTPPPAVPALNPSDPVKIGAQVKVPITWKNDGELAEVKHGSQVQTRVEDGKNRAVILLNDDLTSRPGKVVLSVKFKDGPELPLTLQIVDQQIAVVRE